MLAILSAALVLGRSSAASAQDSPGIDPPAPAEAVRAYRLADAWLRAWNVPPQLATPSPTADNAPEATPGAAGVCVTLTLPGTLRVRAVSWANTPSDRTDLLRRAMLEAVHQLDGRLPLPNDLLRTEAARRLGDELLLSIELAGDPTPIEPATWEDAERAVSPGLEGVLVRSGSDTDTARTEAVFPLAMLTTTQTPARALAAATAKFLGEGGAAEALAEPAKIRAKHALRMGRFRVAHIAQTSPHAEPVFLHRCARPIPQAEITAPELRRFAESLAGNLCRRLSASVERGTALGTIRPVREATSATEAERLLAAYAISRWTNRQSGGAESPRPGCKHPAGVIEAGVAPQSVLNTALGFLLSDASHAANTAAGPKTVPSSSPEVSLLSQMLARLATEADARTISPAEQSLVAYACLRAADVAPGILSPDQANQQLRAVIASTTDVLPGMPWLGWTQVHDPAGPVASGVAFRDMRQQVWEHQVPVSSAPDLTGGIVFTKGGGRSGGGAQLPTWQSARPLAFIATMLADPRLTEPAERTREIVHLMQAFRFLRQLQTDESSVWMYDDAPLALGAIRVAPWDFSLPLDPTSMVLLATVELLDSLDRLEAERPASAIPEQEREASPPPP